MTPTTHHPPTALVTGASRGLGLAVTRSLTADGWRVVAAARDAGTLHRAVDGLPGVVAVSADVATRTGQRRLAEAAAQSGELDLLVNNASALGVSPLPPLAGYPLEQLREVLETNVLGPLALIQLLLPTLSARRGTIVNESSDAAVEAYPGWGGYGASKAALDQLSAVLAAEEPAVSVYAFDPGDMRTDMHQAAFPAQDISDRPAPATVVPAVRRLVRERPASGRYRAADLLEPAGAGR